MALSRNIAASLVLFSLLLLHLSQAEELMSFDHGAPSPSPPRAPSPSPLRAPSPSPLRAPSPSPLQAPAIDCGVACKERCKLAKRQNLCKRSCGSCCAKCKCVPPGTAGNHHLCPCYANLTTRNKVHKCP